MVTLVRDEQWEKAEPPTLVTDDGMVTLVRESQCAKALSPILVNEEGISTIVRDLKMFSRVRMLAMFSFFLLYYELRLSINLCTHKKQKKTGSVRQIMN